MKYRSECNCPCHSGHPVMHFLPCCKPDVEFTTRYVEDLTVSPQPRYMGDSTVMRCSANPSHPINCPCGLCDMERTMQTPVVAWLQFCNQQ